MNVSVDPAALRRLGDAGGDLGGTLRRIAARVDDATRRHVAGTDRGYRVRPDVAARARQAAEAVARLHAWAGEVGRAVEFADRAEAVTPAGLTRVADVPDSTLGDLAFGPAGPPTPPQRVALATALASLVDDWNHGGAATLASPDAVVAAIGRLNRLATLLDEAAWHATTPRAAAELLVTLPSGVAPLLFRVAEDAGRVVDATASSGLDTGVATDFAARWSGPRLRAALLGPVALLMSQAARLPAGREAVDGALRDARATDAGRLMATGVPIGDDLVVALATRALAEQPVPAPVASTARIDAGWPADVHPLRGLLEAMADDAAVAARVLSHPSAAANLLLVPDAVPTATALVGRAVGSIRAMPTSQEPPGAQHRALHALLLAADGRDLHRDLRHPFATLLAGNLAVLAPDLAAQAASAPTAWTPADAGRLQRATWHVAGQVQFEPAAAQHLLGATLAHVPVMVGEVVASVHAATPSDGPLELDAATQEIATAATVAGVVIGGMTAATRDREARRVQVQHLSGRLAAVIMGLGPVRGVAGSAAKPLEYALGDALAEVLVDVDDVAAADLADPLAGGDQFATLVDATVRAHVEALWGPDATDLADDLSTALRDRLTLEQVEAWLVDA